MKYYICEGEYTEQYNASSKAREDAEIICKKEGYKEYFVKTKYGVEKNKLLKVKQIMVYFLNYFQWKKIMKDIKENDEIIVQYPLRNTTIGFSKILKILNKKKIKTTVLIHDLDSLRYPEVLHCKLDDKKILKEFQKVITHNKKMTKYLEQLGVDKNKMVELQLFDYIYEKDIVKIEPKRENEVIIAGNLSTSKAGYLGKINKISEVKFGLFGIGYEKKEEDKNITYNGSYTPSELIENINGKYGLIWDGEDTETCKGAYGEYLKYNNPHKASLYTLVQIPLIVWEKSALADFVIKNNIGIVVDNLNDLRIELDKVSKEQYENMIVNLKELSMRVKKGGFLIEAINKK